MSHFEVVVTHEDRMIIAAEDAEAAEAIAVLQFGPSTVVLSTTEVPASE